MALVVFTTLIASCAADGGSESSQPTSNRREQPISAQPTESETRGEIPTLAAMTLPESPRDLINILTDGRRMYGVRATNGEPTSVARLDTTSGRVLAELPIPPIPAGVPFDGPIAFIATGDEVLALVGDRAALTILDPDTLQLRHEVTLPANTRSELIRVAGPDSEVWVGHRRHDSDAQAGINTLTGVSHVDVDAGRVIETRPIPPCGAKGAVQVRDDYLVFSDYCSNQLNLVGLESGATKIVPTFQHDADLHPLGDDLWLRWTELGYVALLHPESGEMQTLDLNADGPLLRSVFIADRTDGDTVWAIGFLADDDFAGIAYRIDPATVAVTARAYIPSRLTVINGVGYTITREGQAASLDLEDIGSGAPREIVRPSPVEAKPYEPRNRDERDVLATFSRVFDHGVTNAEAAPHLEDAAALDPVRTGLLDLARQLGPSLKLVVTHITVSGNNASISYSYLLNGKIAFVPLAGSLERVGGEWIVSRASMCRLAQQASVTGC
jgi:hypothetical protein